VSILGQITGFIERLDIFTSSKVQGEMLSSAEAIIKATGGTTKAARLAGVKPAAVSNWKAANHIPSRHFVTFYDALQELDLKIDRRIFGFGNSQRGA
jgi:hypothetical protein